MQAEQVVAQLAKPIFGFAVKRTAVIEDAEDIAQEIIFKLYRALIDRDDILEPEKFAWTIAHNTLANYYRKRFRHGNSVPIYGMADALAADDDITLPIEEAETAARLHGEIAYLAKTRRQIVILHYFEGQRQQDIADTLGLPLGTVKWHLSTAKDELRKGMEKMRVRSELKFNPVKFTGISTNGSAGNMGGNHMYLRSTLAQNIIYLTRKKAMTINDIADVLAVSPVYVESEVEYLEENGFMFKQSKGYISNIIIDMPTTEFNQKLGEIYDKAADIFAPELYDALVANVKLGEGGVICPLYDLNFALWAIIPYVTAQSGKPDNKIAFKDVATIRPDGGMNICSCSIVDHSAKPRRYSDSLSQMGGPSWNGNKKFMLWLIDTEWGGDRVGNYHPDIMNRDLSSLKTFFEGVLAEDDAVRMTERGYISREKLETGVRDTLKIVWLNSEARERLLGIANEIRNRNHAAFEVLREVYTELLLKDAPEHLKKARAYEVQHAFHSDGWFIIVMLNRLVEMGKLKPPTDEQCNSLGAVVITE